MIFGSRKTLLMKFTFWAFVSLVCVSLNMHAQSGTIRGFVYDEETDLSIPYANIIIEGTNYGAVANDQGYFIINNVPAGEHDLKVTFIGYEDYTEKVLVQKDRILSLKVYLKMGSELLDDVEVNAERQERDTKVLTGVVTLSPKKIEQFSVGGDADIIKAVQVLPGVITTGDQGGQLFIRGGAPIQSLVMLDGAIIYNPFHSIGFFSVFDADIIESANVYSGGFGAQYGSRNSAVMDIQTRDPNRQYLSGKVQASTYSAKVLMEAPLGKKDRNGRAASSLLLSYKTSYLDQSSQVFYPYIETEYGGLPFNFTDVYGKFTSQSENGSKVNLFGFSFNDDVKFAGNNSIGWNAAGGGIDFVAVPPASTVLLSGDFSFSRYDISALTGEQINPNTSGINGFNGGLDFTYFVGDGDELQYGIEAIGYRTELTLYDEFGNRIDDFENTTELGAYFRYKLARKRFLLEPGLRLHYYSTQSELSLEPRLGAKYNVNEWLRLKASAGLYSQNLTASNSDRDVVNLFYGFLSGISLSQLPDEFRGEPINTSLQKAAHLVTGVEVELSENLSVNLEGYIKDFKQIINVNRNRVSETDPEFIVEEGLAKGIDLLMKYQSKRLYLWFVYSLGEITRDDGTRVYYPYFDRRHNLNFVGTYALDKDQTWEASLRYNFGTGFPFTPTRSFYRQQDFLDATNQGIVSYDYTTENGNLDVLYGDLNTKRLPNYHRVDVSVKKTIALQHRQVVEITGGATNLLNYDNIFYYDRNENKRVDQLPIMPTVSISYKF